MAGISSSGNKKVNRESSERSAQKRTAPQLSRVRSVSKAKTGRYIDLPAVRKLRAAAFSLEEIADMVGEVTRHAVHKWRCGRARPHLKQRECLFGALKIPVHEWLLENEKKKLEDSVEKSAESSKRSQKSLRKQLRALGRAESITVSVDR